MQSSIKSFFGKTVNTSKASISAANKSPVKPVQLVSYSIINTPVAACKERLQMQITSDLLVSVYMILQSVFDDSYLIGKTHILGWSTILLTIKCGVMFAESITIHSITRERSTLPTILFTASTSIK